MRGRQKPVQARKTCAGFWTCTGRIFNSTGRQAGYFFAQKMDRATGRQVFCLSTGSVDRSGCRAQIERPSVSLAYLLERLKYSKVPPSWFEREISLSLLLTEAHQAVPCLMLLQLFRATLKEWILRIRVIKRKIDTSRKHSTWQMNGRAYFLIFV